jgi:hypothetical protein
MAESACPLVAPYVSPKISDFCPESGLSVCISRARPPLAGYKADNRYMTRLALRAKLFQRNAEELGCKCGLGYGDTFVSKGGNQKLH